MNIDSSISPSNDSYLLKTTKHKRMKERENKMRIKHHFFSFLIVLLLLQLLHNVNSQTTGYTCSSSSNESLYPCQTFISYKPISPDFLNLASIADLFGLSRLMITKPSNISSPSSPLLPTQSLLIPITCSCNPNNNTNLSYSNLTYTILKGDTFYQVSTHHFQNLTTYQAVELVNPNLIPTELEIGTQVVFPIFCKCPNKTHVSKQINYLITYVFQPSDTLSSIASQFGSSIESFNEVNGRNISHFDTVFVPVSRIPNITQPSNVVSPLSSPSKDRKRVVIGLGIGLGVTGFLLILLILVMGLWYYREILKKNGEEKGEKHQLRKKKSLKEENLMADVADCLDRYKVYGIEELREATDGFDSGCVIQGSVYKGCIGGEVYAIKRMNWNACEELKILQKVNHGSLVKLDGFCIDQEDGNCYLVYEYIENGSLHSWLHGNIEIKKKLDWKTRLRIAIDVANGLQYIHEHTSPTVVHKDIKTSNILLDRNMRAKIANFGLAKSGCNAITMHIVGTQGYLAPEYLENGVVTTKMDVFAFGVILLELVSGKEPTDEEGKVLWNDVSNTVLEGKEVNMHQIVKKWMDASLVEESCSLESITNVVTVAVACLQRDPLKRPNMVEVVYTLCKSDDLYFYFSVDGLSVSPVASVIRAR